MKKFCLKVGDPIQVISGNEKGKIGKIIAILKKKDRIIVDGINRRIRHVPPNKDKKDKDSKNSGKTKEINAPIHISNVMFFSEKTQCASKIGYRIDGTIKVRYLKKTNEIINKIID